jgi:hypothetical protein
MEVQAMKENGSIGGIEGVEERLQSLESKSGEAIAAARQTYRDLLIGVIFDGAVPADDVISATLIASGKSFDDFRADATKLKSRIEAVGLLRGTDADMNAKTRRQQASMEERDKLTEEVRRLTDRVEEINVRLAMLNADIPAMTRSRDQAIAEAKRIVETTGAEWDENDVDLAKRVCFFEGEYVKA